MHPHPHHTVNFLQKHGDHYHLVTTKVPDDPAYLIGRGVQFYFADEMSGDDETFRIWTTTAGGQMLAAITVRPDEVAFDVAYRTLRDATLDVLNVGECE